VAEALDWSLSKVNRIESGEVTVSTTDLRALLALFGIADDARVDRLLENAKASRRRGWWDEPKYREHLNPATMQLLQFETEASAIRVYQPTLVPGLLQTNEYAETILNLWDELPEAHRAVRLEVRMRRREQVFSRPDPPQYFVILDESVLMREFGGLRVMAEQFREMLRMAAAPNIMIRVLPLANGTQIAMAGQFSIFDLGDEENAILYRESALGDEISQVLDDLRRRRHLFEQTWLQSLTVEASIRLIEARTAALLSAIDVRQPSG
jgi:hypothetical protein